MFLLSYYSSWWFVWIRTCHEHGPQLRVFDRFCGVVMLIRGQCPAMIGFLTERSLLFGKIHSPGFVCFKVIKSMAFSVEVIKWFPRDIHQKWFQTKRWNIFGDLVQAVRMMLQTCWRPNLQKCFTYVPRPRRSKTCWIDVSSVENWHDNGKPTIWRYISYYW